MKAYVYSVLLISLVSGAVCILCPEKKGLSKYVSFVCAAASALTLLLPFTRGIGVTSPEELFSLEESQSPGGVDSARSISSAAADILSAAYGEKKSSFSAKAQLDEAGNIEKIVLRNEDISLPGSLKIAEKLTELFGLRIEVYGKDGD